MRHDRPHPPRKHGFLARISWRAKLIVLLSLFVAASLALVMAFAAGFATSMVMTETGAKDRCASAQGSWDDGKDLCTLQPQKAEAASEVTDAETYSCADGRGLAIQTPAPEKRRIMVSDGAVHEVVQDIPGATTFADPEVRLSLDGPDVFYQDRVTGNGVLCSRDVNPLQGR